MKEMDRTDLKRDGKSHPANISKRAFGDRWPGFPLNLARYGSEFLNQNKRKSQICQLVRNKERK